MIFRGHTIGQSTGSQGQVLLLHVRYDSPRQLQLLWTRLPVRARGRIQQPSRYGEKS